MEIFDGAMGTMLHSYGLPPGECPEYINIEEPQMVTDIHLAFIEAGADVIQTNTFGGNRIKLSKYGYEKEVTKINRAAVRNAKKAALGSPTKIAVSIGPTGKILEPWGTFSFDDALEVYEEQVYAALQERPDMFIIETMGQLSEARAALLAARSLTDAPIITTMTFEKNCRTTFGTPPESVAITLSNLGADIVGVNCVGDFDLISEIVSRMSRATEKPIIAQPNAGNPSLLNGTTVFPLTPKTFAVESSRLVDKGAHMLGGCCGTMPQHTRELASEVKSKPTLDTQRSCKYAATSTFETIYFKPKEEIPGLGETDFRQDVNITKEEIASLLIKDAKLQKKDGAKIVTIDLSYFNNKDVNIIRDLVNTLQKTFRGGMCVEGGCVEILETALKLFHGRTLLRLGCEDYKNEKITPLAEKYGALILPY